MRAQHVGQEAAWEPSFSECARIHSVLLREPTPCACYLFIILFYYIIINLFGVGWEGGGGCQMLQFVMCFGSGGIL